MSVVHTPRYPKSLGTLARQFAIDHLNETETKRVEYVQLLRSHFEENEPSIHLSDADAFLVAFLRGCKYNLERTITKVRNYYIMRGNMPEIFAQRDPEAPRIQKLLKLGFALPLRKFHADRLVMIGRLGCYDPKEFHLTDILKVAHMIADICSRICPRIQVHGVCFLVDMQGIGIGHLRQFTPSIIKHIVISCENYHFRPKQLEFFNAPTCFNVVLNILRTLMSAKLKRRFRVHSNGNACLSTIMDKSILPEEYGGDDGTLNDHIQFWCEEVKRHRDWLLHDEQFVAGGGRKG